MCITHYPTPAAGPVACGLGLMVGIREMEGL